MGVNISKKRFAVLIILFFLIIKFFPFIAISDSEAQVNDLTINIPNSEPRNKYDKPVFIRGIWHYVNISLNSEINEATIIFYYGDIPPDLDDRNETNYYKWKYDYGSWRDLQHNITYIDENNCYHNVEFNSFYIGIDQYANLGNWTLILSVSEEQLFSKQIYVDNAVSFIVLKSIPILVNVEPFTEDMYISNNKYTIENQGNVPLRLSVNFGKYENTFSTIESVEILKPDETKKYNIMVQSSSTWKPGTLTIKAGEASIRGHVQNIIPPKRIVSLIGANVSIALPIIINIGHSGFTLESLMRNITFQYIENLNIYYYEIKDIFSFISGNGNVNVNITGKNIDIIKVLSDGNEVGIPFLVKSINTSEHPITVRARGIMPNSTGYLYYSLEIDGEIQKFISKINIGSFKPEREKTLNITLILVMIAFIVVSFLVFTQIKHWKK